MRKIWLRVLFLAIIPLLFIQFFFCQLGHQFYPAIIYPSFANSPEYDETHRFFVIKTYTLTAITADGRQVPVEAYKILDCTKNYASYAIRARLDITEACLLNDKCLRQKAKSRAKYHIGPIRLALKRPGYYDPLVAMSLEERTHRYDEFKQWLKQRLKKLTQEEISALEVKQNVVYINIQHPGKPIEKSSRSTLISLTEGKLHV